MKEEKVIAYLKELNFWGKENIYFLAMEAEKFSNNQQIMYETIDSLNYKYYIINKNENGIGIIPFDLTLLSLKEGSLFINERDIKEVYIEKYKFLIILKGTRLTIKTNDNKVIEIEYKGSEKGNFSNINMYKFVETYKKEGKYKEV